MSATEEREYVLGTRDDEVQRLGFQHAVWREVTARLWEAARFAPGERILDLGCGPGYGTMELAQLVGSTGAVIGVDVSRRFLSVLQATVQALKLPNISWHESDVHTLPLADASVDGVFARWVLSFTASPGDVLRDVARVLRPGGRVAVLDYANYAAFAMAPGSSAVDRVIAATGQSIDNAGGDFNLGRRLPSLMVEAGLEVTSLEPVSRIARPDSALWQWPATFFANFLPVLEQSGLISADEAQAFRDVWRERSANPAAYLITPTMVSVVGIKR